MRSRGESREEEEESSEEEDGWELTTEPGAFLG